MTEVWIAGLKDPVLIETAWERQMQISGLENYEASRAGMDPSATRYGKKLMRRLIVRAEKAIEKLQKELLDTDRIERAKKGTVVAIPAETLALIALRAMIDKTYNTTLPERGAIWHRLAVQIAKACETELNFRHWVSTSRIAAKEYAKTKGLAAIPPSTADMLIEEHGSNRAQIGRWKKTIKELSQYEWTENERLFCGDAILTAICQELGDCFAALYLAGASSSQKFVRMTDSCRQKFDDSEYTTATMQTVRKPMLTRPRPWTAHQHEPY